MKTIYQKEKDMEFWHSGDFEKGAVNLSKTSLGRFVHAVIQYDGYIVSHFCLDKNFPRAWVGFVVKMTKEDRDSFVENTGFVLNYPPKINLN